MWKQKTCKLNAIGLLQDTFNLYLGTFCEIRILKIPGGTVIWQHRQNYFYWSFTALSSCNVFECIINFISQSCCILVWRFQLFSNIAGFNNSLLFKMFPESTYNPGLLIINQYYCWITLCKPLYFSLLNWSNISNGQL